ncbi:DUF4397 domain-containing protein [Mucilaginibacter gotjawali]|uniref:Uncharacterized protein n=2 Tax=Mucilaginibacter gotjawali TaxID=1550579 RepID=A0A839S7P2_9SPHI|nr:DUF4397 domain-containing protein [Mucilaginibacter gotjawali]MBB3053806.1 hypothetical protein [Mucilaginibacter gotjawali]BAU54068.1 hypothetical protein MgSA37_02239 [Mucilaginibacter gotjawali]
MWKIYFNLFSILGLSLVLASCKKELTNLGSGTSSLTIVNAVVGNDYLLTDFKRGQSTGNYLPPMNGIHYGTATYFNSYSGQQPLALYHLPDTTATSAPVFKLTLDLPVNTIHTLFLMGTQGDPDQLLTTDQLPYHPDSDSTMGIRFINISKTSHPVSVNIAGQANGSEATGLAYKSVTPFKNYNAGSAIKSYTFEFRDQATGELLGSCIVDGVNNDGSSSSPNIRRYKNFTIALLGAPGGNAPNSALIISEDIAF